MCLFTSLRQTEGHVQCLRLGKVLCLNCLLLFTSVYGQISSWDAFYCLHELFTPLVECGGGNDAQVSLFTLVCLGLLGLTSLGVMEATNKRKMSVCSVKQLAHESIHLFYVCLHIIKGISQLCLHGIILSVNSQLFLDSVYKQTNFTYLCQSSFNLSKLFAVVCTSLFASVN